MRLRFDTSRWDRKVNAFPELIKKEVDVAFFRLIEGAMRAMESVIEDYPTHSNSSLVETLQNYGIEPEVGLLRRSLKESMNNKTRKYRNNITRKIIDFDKLDSLTPWGGVAGRRPIQNPGKWKNNPYQGHGFWKTYNDGFTWDADTRIIGRNFLTLGQMYLESNYKREYQLAMRRAMYHFRKM